MLPVVTPTRNKPWRKFSAGQKKAHLDELKISPTSPYSVWFIGCSADLGLLCPRWFSRSVILELVFGDTYDHDFLKVSAFPLKGLVCCAGFWYFSRVRTLY